MTTVSHDPEGLYEVLAALDRPCYIVSSEGRPGATHHPPAPGSGTTLLAAVGPLAPQRLGSADFRRHHGLRYAYMAGAMAGGIASVELVTALARAGHLASFGSAGLPEDRIDQALGRLTAELAATDTPFACNLIHNPLARAMEKACVDACLRHGVHCLEASAFVQLTPDLVRYRVAGLRRDPATGVRSEHRLIAKVSHPHTAELFLRPAPHEIVADLKARGLVPAEQAELARTVPMADDITAEADSGGHTDRRPLAILLPALIRLRDLIAREHPHPHGTPVRIGAAGGIGTPHAMAAAFALGADYVVTGSVNQATTEAGTSPGVKRLLAQAGLADCTMAPAADMFEQGVQVQVLARGTLFPGNAARLYRLYREHTSLDDLPADECRLLQERILRRPLEQVVDECTAYLKAHQPDQLPRAERDPKYRMALVFRWYLAMASRWATSGQTERSGDWQVWCGPAMGAFNAWTAGSALAAPEQRHAATIAEHLLRGAAFHSRVSQLRLSGVRLPASCAEYRLPSPSPRTPASAGKVAARATRHLSPSPSSRLPSDRLRRKPRS
ncbi:PfaD family polyunsaturated fatty acid/polyketide biosynthesis protein [Streptomyces yunnanensis]|uniref:PfaD family polyunsaturated fatty acid/polyketide biosynthesis protein n=1 Tax=Streptomyces yunnanensis TaxID=156453 RepID=A0ABY8A6P5_9ACTN|nr:MULTISPECIES: PfaD family polyunsaturated fatty acid/polyketide biosynthesis protein [Streptomyces]WEB39585.1 PfaD family polyunsaturated fatty acid/polyketide biosynthesis protein [Streptomyces yunnanensis]